MTSSETDGGRAPNDFPLGVVTGFVLFFVFGAVSLIARPIPADIYPTFAFRPQDGPAFIGLFVAVNMAWFAILAAAIVAAVAWCARRGRRAAAVAVAAIAQVTLLAGSIIGGTGKLVGTYRWPLAAGLVLGSAAGFAFLGWLWTRIPARRRLVAAGAAVATLFATDAVVVTALGNFANLYGMVFIWLAIWTLGLVVLFLHEVIADLGGVGPRGRRVLRGAAIVVALLALVDVSGALGTGFLHVRRVYDWRCPEAAAFVNLSRTAQLDVFKLKSAMRASSAGAVIDTSLLAAARKPKHSWNVIFFVIDALRRDRVGAFNPKVHTPTIDALAAESVLYDHAYSPSPTTGYSIVSYLSGVLPNAAVQADGPPIFLPYVLRHFGFETGASASFEGLHDMVPVLAGFDSDDIGFTDVTDLKISHFDPTFDRKVVDALISRLEHTEKPRFEYIHLFATHGPFRPPDSVAHYDAAVRSADAQLGRLIESLRASGEWDQTMLIVMGDHGEGLGEHGMYAHSQSLYVEQTAVPLIVRIPGATPTVHHQPITTTILPTMVMDALGGHWPVDTSPEIADGTLNEDFAAQEFHIRSELVWRAIRMPPWSYHHRILDGTRELYNLDEDPGEARDVASEHPDIVRKMRAIEDGLDG